MQTLLEQLKKHTISRIHLLYGEERYLVDYYCGMITRELAAPGDDMNYTVFQGEKLVPSEIADVAQLLPFLAEQRLIVVKDSGFFHKQSDMKNFIGDFPETTYLVFSERKVDKRNALYKWVAKNGCVTEFKAQDINRLQNWIQGYFKKLEKTIDRSVSAYFLERVGTSMENLKNEMDKVAGFSGERDKITREDVDAVCSGAPASQIYAMMDAVAEKETKKALALYADLLRNHDEEARGMLSLFTYHINVLLRVKELEGLGLNNYKMAGKLRIPADAVPRYVAQAKKFKNSQLLSMLEQRADVEERMNKGQISDQLAIEMFLIQAMTSE